MLIARGSTAACSNEIEDGIGARASTGITVHSWNPEYLGSLFPVTMQNLQQ